MKEQILKTLDKVAEMREAQRNFFAARKRHDVVSAQRYLEQSKALEKEVDDMLNREINELKYGKQGNLFDDDKVS